MSQDLIKDKQVNGLYKRVSPTKAVWAVKARQKGTGRVVTVTLGRCDVIGLAEARKQAKEVLAKLAGGVNPNEEREQQVALFQREKALTEARGLTLQHAFQQYLEDKGLRPSTAKGMQQCFSRNFGDWMHKPLLEITRESVAQRYKDIRTAVSARRAARNAKRLTEGAPITKFTNADGDGEAQRSFRYLSSVIGYVMSDYIGGRPLLESNPIDVLRDKKMRKLLRPKTRHLLGRQIVALRGQLEIVGHPEYKGPITVDDADFVMLLLLTGMRLNELKMILWENVNFTDRVLKATGTKNRTDHTIPMTESIGRILKRRLAANTGGALYVFPSVRDIKQPASISRGLDRVCEGVGFTFTAHDLRRTFATVASDVGVDVTKIGAALNHTKIGVTARYIQISANTLRETFESIEAAIFEPNGYDIERDETANGSIEDVDTSDYL